MKPEDAGRALCVTRKLVTHDLSYLSVLAQLKRFDRAARYRKAGQTQLFVKQVSIEGKRYVVCRNEEEARRSRKDRAAIVAALDEQLKKGRQGADRQLAYRRYLRKVSDNDKRSFEIDAGKLAEEARPQPSAS